jgi:hypothetical protein
MSNVVAGGEKKIIRINPEMFKVANNNTRKKGTDRKEPKPIKMKTVNRDKTLKRDMLRRIRANQAEQYNKIFGGTDKPNSANNPIRVSTEEKFDSGFKDTMDFMNKLVDKHKREPVQQKHNQTVRAPEPRPIVQGPSVIQPIVQQPIVQQSFVQRPSVQQPIVQQSFVQRPSVQQPIVKQPFVQVFSGTQQIFPQPQVQQPPVQGSSGQGPIFPQAIAQQPLVQAPLPGGEPPKYGCLKNGSLPTYRTSMNKTVKATDVKEKPKTDNAIDRIRARLNERANRQQAIKVPKTKPNKLIRRTYHVGKDKYRPSVGVLLPNRTIRNKVTNKSFMLKNTPIDEIRRFLLKQGFIKVGSTSPNDVLRKMYESIMMIDGEIKNYNPDNLLYNFFNDKPK